MNKPDAISIRGEIAMLCSPRTVGELREFMKVLDSYYLKDETPILEGYIDISVSGSVDPIQCGCSVPDKPREFYVDALVLMHNCQE